MQPDNVVTALEILQSVLEYAGTIAFAISGAIAAGRRRMDLAGVVVLGTIVAVGGGTLRDMLLGSTPVFWVRDPTFVIVGALAALATVPLFRFGVLHKLERFRLVKVSDAAGMSLFVVTGTNVALAAGANWLSAAVIGVISGVGGGIIRDVLADRTPDVLSDGRLYATAAMAGALVHLALLQLPISPAITIWIPIATIFSIRMLSLGLGWGVPAFDAGDEAGI